LNGSERLVKFSEPVEPYFPKIGHVPLPPYIHEKLNDPERYQTVYAREPGSAAAPTAGLHFTPRLLDELEAKGVKIAYVTLHVGLDTFAPVTEDEPGRAQDPHRVVRTPRRQQMRSMRRKANWGQGDRGGDDFGTDVGNGGVGNRESGKRNQSHPDSRVHAFTGPTSPFHFARLYHSK
jgi:hypothetical protein